MLDVPYVHVVFTLPHALLPHCYRNAPTLYTTTRHRWEAMVIDCRALTALLSNSESV